FPGESNGNLPAGNVSKVPLGSLMSGRTPAFVHLMPWFGITSHVDVGYDSADPAQIKKQVDDLMSRGIRGAIVDWYGPSNTQHDTSTINLRFEAERRNGEFQFGVTEDGGALRDCANTPGCDLTTQLISDLTYAYNTFEVSPAYIHVSGRPVVHFFNVERFAFGDVTRLNIDW